MSKFAFSPRVEHMEAEHLDERDVDRALQNSGYSDNRITSVRYKKHLEGHEYPHMYETTYGNYNTLAGPVKAGTKGNVYLRKREGKWEGEY